MADAKVLYEIPGSAPSGAANALFDLFQTRKALDQKTREATMLSGLKRTEQKEQNDFLTALEERRHAHLTQRAQEHDIRTQMWEQQKAQEKAMAAQQMAVGAAESGMNIPGTVTQSPEAAMATGSPMGTFEAMPVQPGGADLYSQSVLGGIKEHYARQREARTADRDYMMKMISGPDPLIGEEHVRAASTLADSLQEHDPILAARLRAFQPGNARLSDLNAAMSKGTELSTRTVGRLTALKFQEEQRNHRAKLAADVREKVAGLMSQSRLTSANRQQLTLALTNLQRVIANAEADQARLQTDIIYAESPSVAAKARAEYAAGRVQLDELRRQQTDIVARLMQPEGIDITPDEQAFRWRAMLQAATEVLPTKRQRILKDVKSADELEAQLTPEEVQAVAKRYQEVLQRGQTTPKSVPSPTPGMLPGAPKG